MSNYHKFISRNNGYIEQTVQEKISKINVLIAGCGMGSMTAEILCRIGIQNFTLVDSDTIEIHNLNRQSYRYNDIEKSKGECLKENILSINPEANVTIYDEFLSETNVNKITENIDIIIDTIDFVDFKAILSLHKTSHLNKIPIITAINAGQGAFVLASLCTGDKSALESLFELDSNTLATDESFLELYYAFIAKISSELDEDVPRVMQDVLSKMSKGEACPAPQLATGSYLVASIVSSYIIDIVSESYKLKYFPNFNVIDLKKVLG